MKLDSWKKSIIMGLIAGGISYILYVLLVVGSAWFTGWQMFFQSDFTAKTYGICRWETFAAVGVILFSLVPVFSLRYEKFKYVFLYLLISFLAVIWLFGTVLAGWFLIVPQVNCLFITLDAMYYLTIVLPIGSAIGTVVALVLRIMNKD